MKQIDKICLEIIDVYKDITKTTNFVNVFRPAGNEFQDSVVNSLIDRFSLTKAKKSIYPVSSDQLPYKFIIPYHSEPYIANDKRDKKTYKKLISKNKTGLFKITFNDGSLLLVARWFEGYGKMETLQHLVIGEFGPYASYLRALESHTKIVQKPKPGVYRVVMTQFGPNYAEIKDLPTSPVIHPKVEEVENDIEYYFNNVNLYTRFKQSGVRKFMLISEPGTGKSSIFYKIAKKYAKEKSIVFATDIESAAYHLSACAKSKVSTIIFIEDADSTLGNMHGSSSVLNFLDGVDTPYNPNGSLILMSTNYPEKIEKRILTRPGRIDKIFHIDALKGDWALRCAELYFDEYFDVSKNSSKMLGIVDGMTGAQIKELALASMSYAASNAKDIDISLIKEVKEVFAKNLSEAYKYAEENSVKRLTKGAIDSFGFNEF